MTRPDHNLEMLQDQLCQHLCADIRIQQKNQHLIRIQTPFQFPDGDSYQLFLRELPTGLMELTDGAHTFMQMSYEMDIDSIFKGNRKILLDQVLTEMAMKLSDTGELIKSTQPDQIHQDMLHMAQAITKVWDLTYLKRSRVESTFYDDLERQLFEIVPDAF